MTKQMKQAYQQKPWRRQMKWVSRLLLIAFFVALGSAIYLGLAGEVTAVSQQLRELNRAKNDLQERIASHESELARLSTARAIQPKLEALGYEHYSYEDVVYVGVAGYEPLRPAQLAPPASERNLTQPVLRSSYTQSLWDWLTGHASSISQLGGFQ